jgi:hypothetical protein
LAVPTLSLTNFAAAITIQNNGYATPAVLLYNICVGHIVNERLKESKDRLDKMASEIQFYSNEFMAYVKQYGHRRLTDEERKNVDPMFWGVEVMHTINDDE